MPIITGTPDDDLLFGTPDPDEIYGLGGNDGLFGDAGNDLLDGGEGHDFLRGDEDNDILLGGSEDDFLNGGVGDDLLDGGTGLDRAAYSTGAIAGVTVDLRIAGVAQDTGSQGFDTLIGIEHVSGTRFDDVLDGDDNDNWVWGGSDGSGVTGNDILSGHGGNDLIWVGAGNHSADGGTGGDTISFFGNMVDITADGVTVSLALQGMVQDTEQGMMLLAGFENLSGSTFDDDLAGDGDGNVLLGDIGNDAIFGGGGADTLYGDGRTTVDTHDTGTSGPIVTYADVSLLPFAGAPGDDILDGGDGDDTLDGGGGSDTASYAGASGGVQAELAFGSTGAAGNDTYFSIENLIGSEFNDELFGDGGSNVLAGLGGDDLIFAFAGDDDVDGGDGDDFLAGQQGNDTINGGLGHELIRPGTGDDLVDGGDGFDRVSYFQTGSDVITTGVTVSLLLQGAAQDTGSQGFDTLTSIEALSGTAFDDLLIGDHSTNWLTTNNGNDTLIGNGGDDLIEAIGGDHVIDGGDDIDTVSFRGLGLVEGAASASLLLQGMAQDTGQGVMILSGIENLSGTMFDDTLEGDGGDNMLLGHDGADALLGGDGNDTLYGDGAVIGDFNPALTSGPPTIFADLGGNGDDTLDGGEGDDTLDGGGGIDTASFASASAEIFVSLADGFASGAGEDALINMENVMGSAFNDQILGDDNANLLAGEDGHDFIRSGLGADTLLGGAGDDFLQGQGGDDLLDGGSGLDRAAYSTGAAAGVTVDLRIDGIAQDTGSQGFDTLVSIEHVSGTVFDDVLHGDEGDNWVWGGSNGISGPTGNDVLRGHGGNDLIEVGTGNHVLRGGGGNDTLSLWGNRTDVTADGVTVSLQLQGMAQNTEQGLMDLDGFENLSGSIFADSLTGDNDDNVLAGDEGGDELRGRGGDDILYGDGRIMVDSHGTGTSGPIVTTADVAAAFGDASGNDALHGGAGRDTLVGGGGDDVLSGDGGHDTFLFGVDSGDDRITDFANADTIRFEGIAGVDDFSDLTLTRVGRDTLISWGTADSILVENSRPAHFGASDFSFG